MIETPTHEKKTEKSAVYKQEREDTEEWGKEHSPVFHSAILILHAVVM